MRVDLKRYIVFCVLLLLIAATSSSQNTLDNIEAVDNTSQTFIPLPQYGYVMKKSLRYDSKMPLLYSNLQGVQSRDVKYLKVANRPEITVAFGRQSLYQNENNIRTLSSQPDTEYIAPLYKLEGETVAIIPEIIVRIEHETDRYKLEELCMKSDCTILRNLLYTEQEFLISPAARNAEDVLKTVEILGSADFVEWAFPNIAFQPKISGQSMTNGPNRIEPNDVYFCKQWHLDVIQAPRAWAYTTGDPNIIIAVLDTRIDINHPDLVNNIWTNPNEIAGNGIDDDENGLIDDVHGWDFTNNDNNTPPDEHGTACAGLIAAQGNNSIGVTGVAPNCTIMPVCILPFSGTCDTLTEPVDGLRYAAAQGADVINNSWNVNTNCPPIYSAIQDITRSGGIGRNRKGCIVCCSTGNTVIGGLATYPSVYSEVIAVGAVQDNDRIWYYSGNGFNLDIVAPSGDINLEGDLWTTDVTGIDGFNNRNRDILDYTDKMGGTSGACSIVSGVAALILSIEPFLTNIEVQDILLQSARDLGTPGWDEYYGFGCIDAFAAVTMTPNSSDLISNVDNDAPGDPEPGDPNQDGSF